MKLKLGSKDVLADMTAEAGFFQVCDREKEKRWRVSLPYLGCMYVTYVRFYTEPDTVPYHTVHVCRFKLAQLLSRFTRQRSRPAAPHRFIHATAHTQTRKAGVI